MNRKLLVILALFATLAIGSSLWQAYEAAHLDEKLRLIDKKAQRERLMRLSLSRVEPQAAHLLAEEAAKQSDSPDFTTPVYPEPCEEKADFNKGFFLLSPAQLMTPPGQGKMEREMTHDAVLMDALMRKATHRDAPIADPFAPQTRSPRTGIPVFGVYQVKETDFSKPILQEGKPGDYFAWAYKGNVYFTRAIPTTHGNAMQGFIADPAVLARHLLPFVEPGLDAPKIRAALPGEKGMGGLPLVLEAGERMELPDTAERRRALRGTVVSAWLISISSIAIVFGLLALYARVERRRSDFVSAVTHELRTPLTSFTLYTEMLRENKAPAEKLPEYYETLHRESKRLAHLVENVLAFSRLTRGKARGRQDTGFCARMLGEIFDRVGERLSKSGFKVVVNQDPRVRLLSLRTDLLTVEQILDNLADNAVKYARGDEGEHPSIIFSVVQTHRRVVIRVSDSGPGIAGDARRNLFRPFSRSAEAEQGRKPGVGLGLALSRDLARSIGGDLVLEKSDSHGSTFALTLPLGE